MTKGQKLFITFIVIGTVICLLVGSTFAYWSWSSNSAQATTVAFTVASDFSCSADGGGNLTSSDVELAPAKCTDPDYAIKRTVKVSTTQNSDKTIYLDMKLKVDSLIHINLCSPRSICFSWFLISTRSS